MAQAGADRTPGGVPAAPARSRRPHGSRGALAGLPAHGAAVDHAGLYHADQRGAGIDRRRRSAAAARGREGPMALTKRPQPITQAAEWIGAAIDDLAESVGAPWRGEGLGEI